MASLHGPSHRRLSAKLYYNDYSICSIMVRYAVACCRHLQDPSLELSEQSVDIQHGEQLSEHYLCEVNPRGTVPVLWVSKPGSPRGLIESLDITHFLGEWCPHLFAADESMTRELLYELHSINFFSLTYTHKPQRAADMESAVLTKLSDPELSDRYRDALNHKLAVIHTTRFPALEAEAVAAEESKTLDFLTKVKTLLDLSGSPWIFGTEEPSALDTHTVPLIARLMDVGRESMLPPKVKTYAVRAFETEEWRTIMADRKTVFGSYL